VQAGEYAEKRRLPRAVRRDQPDPIARRDDDIHLVEHEVIPEGHGHAAGNERRTHEIDAAGRRAAGANI
jgi:hypothetical protein